MKILLTGASGFIGKKVLDRLKEIYGYDSVIALSSCNLKCVKTVASKNYKFDKNYLAENGCEDVEVLLHIGAFIPKSTKDADNIEFTTENIFATQKLLNSDWKNLKKIVFISTVDVYQHRECVLSEKTSTVPMTLYGWSKLYCEQLVQKYCEQKNIGYEILRLGHVYGEGEEKYKKVMPVMIRSAIEGKDLNIYGDGEAIRSYIYISDVVEAIVNSIPLEKTEIINVVGDEQVTINQLADMICSYVDGSVNIIHTPVDTPNVNFVFDNSKLRKYLLKSLTKLEMGLKKECDYMKEKLMV
jgi:nucleoside-diphosphate-sugar epimerase